MIFCRIYAHQRCHRRALKASLDALQIRLQLQATFCEAFFFLRRTDDAVFVWNGTQAAGKHRVRTLAKPVSLQPKRLREGYSQARVCLLGPWLGSQFLRVKTVAFPKSLCFKPRRKVSFLLILREDSLRRTVCVCLFTSTRFVSRLSSHL